MAHRRHPIFVLLVFTVLGVIPPTVGAQGLDTRSLDAPSLDASAFAALEIAETESVVEIVDGDTLVLADGRQVRLVGLQMTDGFKAIQPGSSSTPIPPTNARIPP